MKVAEIREELRSRGLEISGSKTDLEERLQQVLDEEALKLEALKLRLQPKRHKATHTNKRSDISGRQSKRSGVCQKQLLCEILVMIIF